MDITGNVRRIIKFSAVDGPGNRAAVFLQGCNFNCGYCHNPETIALKSQDAKFISVNEVFIEIASAINFIRGITLSGGEATLQMDFVISLFNEAKKRGLDTFLDTNGSADFSACPEIMAVTDFVMLDIKSMDFNEHMDLCGAPNDMPIHNIKYLADLNKLYEIRTVLSPTIINCAETVEKAARLISGYDIIYKLIKYRPNGVRGEYLSKYKVPLSRFMEQMEQLALKNGARKVVVI